MCTLLERFDEHDGKLKKCTLIIPGRIFKAKITLLVTESFLNSHVWSNENKSYMKVDVSLQVRVSMRVFSTLNSYSNENNSCMKVEES